MIYMKIKRVEQKEKWSKTNELREEDREIRNFDCCSFLMYVSNLNQFSVKHKILKVTLSQLGSAREYFLWICASNAGRGIVICSVEFVLFHIVSLSGDLFVAKTWIITIIMWKEWIEGTFLVWNRMNERVSKRLKQIKQRRTRCAGRTWRNLTLSCALLRYIWEPTQEQTTKWDGQPVIRCLEWRDKALFHFRNHWAYNSYAFEE